MKFLIMLIISGLIALLFGPFLPFWGIMLTVAVLAALVGGKKLVAFAACGLGVGAIWFAVPMWVSLSTGSQLPAMIGVVVGLENPVFLVLITALLGFLMGGFSALTGNSFRKIFEEKETPYYR